MIGTIHYCLEECIITKYGKGKWVECLAASGFPINHTFCNQLKEDIDDETTMSFIKKSAEVLGITLQQLFDDFGYHWCVEYAPKLYVAFYVGCHSTKDIVLKLSQIHDIMAKIRHGHKPPRFEYDELAPNKTKVNYISDRNLFDLYLSLVKGLDAYLKNETKVEKLSDKSAILTFSHY